MEKKRIGKTLKIRWSILTGGEPEPLAGRDLTLEISSGNRVRTTLSFVADGNVAAFVFEGSEQRYVGPYTVTMWENLGKEGQTVVDRCDAFCLVARSCEEAESGSAEDPGLEIESLDLGTSNFEAGVPGSSAYELFKKYNPDSELTEEEYAESPIQAAGVALAMVEQLEETEVEVKQAEQLRKQAEQGREASEQNRATAEQGRVAAEQQRALAEQTRVTNESARQTAEAGRQAAETKREENTAEAIRNSEEATRKAEDEAARVRMLADNPPKIVEVEGAKYWATWNEATGQYVVSENRADVGDAVLFSPQVLTPQQQAQARANINVEKSGSAYNISKICNLNPFVLNWSNLPGYSSNHAFKNIFIKGNYIYAQKTSGTLSGGIQKFDTAGNSIAADHNDWVTNSHFQIFLVKGDFLYGIRNKNSIVKLNVSDLSTHSKVSYSFTNENAIYQLGDKIIVFNNSSIYEMDEDTLDMRLIDTISDVRFAYIGQTRNNLIIVTDTTAYEYDDNYQILNQRDLPSNFSGSNLKWVAPKGKLSYNDEGIIILNTSNKITFLYFSYSTPSDTGVQIPTEYLFDNSLYEISGIFRGTIDYDTSYILAPRGFLLELYGGVGRPSVIRKTIPLRYNTNDLNANAGGNSDRLACACSIPNVILL